MVFPKVKVSPRCHFYAKQIFHQSLSITRKNVKEPYWCFWRQKWRRKTKKRRIMMKTNDSNSKVVNGMRVASRAITSSKRRWVVTRRLGQDKNHWYRKRICRNFSRTYRYFRMGYVIRRCKIFEQGKMLEMETGSVMDEYNGVSSKNLTFAEKENIDWRGVIIPL